MEETVIKYVVENAVESGLQAMVRQIGYCIYYKKNVKNLDEKVRALQAMRTEIQEKVTAAKKNLDSIRKNVEIWLENVKKEMEGDDMMVGLMNFINGEEAKMFNHDVCCKSWCCLLSRHKIGREAHRKNVIVEELLNDGSSFENVSYPCANWLASVITHFISTDDNVAFASREFIMNEIMSSLKDEETYSVGIYGMGGIGKTMLKNRVHKQVVEEKLFNIVATITVSQNIDVKKIQDEIAQIFGFEKLNGIDNTATRAALLLQRLEQEENILVIFDDLWTINLNLFTHVGIPCRYKRCKVLITTRILGVCRSLKIQKIVEVKGLSEDESWHLFKQNVGDVVDSTALQTVAKEVVKECCCLPLALVTVGRALHHKDKLEWDYTAKKLRSSNFEDIEGMTSEVYTPIKLSYDFLGNDVLKRCFLLCCLFPEDHNTHVEDLLFYAVGDTVIRGDFNGKVFPDQTFLAKMHDVVLAISIASRDGSRFYVKAGLDLQNWPEAGSLSISKCSRLSLIDNNITELPDQPELPHLLSISLRYNMSLYKIPDKFFKNMSALQSLDIHGIRISTLPSSISSLVNLRSLDMGFCVFHNQLDISSLGELKKLEMLNLANLGLSISLPKEIGGLSRLKWLDLSGNTGLTVPPDIISRLTCLEYLDMEDSFEGWEIGEIRGESSGASPFFNSVNIMVAKAETVHLHRCSNLKGLASLITSRRGSGFNNIKRLEVSDCKEMYCVLSSGTVGANEENPNALFTALEEMCLSSLPNLKEVFHCLMPAELSLENLKRVELDNCPDLVCIFPEVLWNKLKNLEVLKVTDCRRLKEVFPLGEGIRVASNDQKQDHSNYHLRELSLKNLTITSIWKPAMFSLGNLKSLEVIHCSELKYLFTPATVTSLQRLETLHIINCNSLVTIVAAADELTQEDEQIMNPHFQTTAIFPNLRVFKVNDCKSLKVFSPPVNMQMLVLEEGEDYEYEDDYDYDYDCDDKRALILGGVRYLKDIWGGIIPPVQSFLNVTEVIIGKCGWLKHLIPVQVLLSGGLSQLRKLHVLYCESLEAIIDTDDDIIVDSPPQNEVILANLEILVIWKCKSLKYILPMKLLVQGGGLPKLEVINVHKCEKVKMICYEDGSSDVHDDNKTIILATVEVFPRLRTLSLSYLPQLSSIHHQRNTLIHFGWPSLVSLFIIECNFKSLPLSHKNVPPKLENIVGITA
ncbi:hypothetical protein MKW94_021474, partial [Papaver nudicaule]|nr:hypothetical protein [Papaver nudicaule]